jgi:hypothetical protein
MYNSTPLHLQLPSLHPMQRLIHKHRHDGTG